MKNDFFKTIAIETAVDKEIVEKVINHSLDGILRNSRKCSSMEITGWGTFYIREKRVPYYIKGFEGKIEKLKVHLKTLTQAHARKELEGKIEWMENELKVMKKRYGMEEG